VHFPPKGGRERGFVFPLYLQEMALTVASSFREIKRCLASALECHSIIMAGAKAEQAPRSNGGTVINHRLLWEIGTRPAFPHDDVSR